MMKAAWRAFLVALCLLFSAASARADMTYEEFDRHRGSVSIQLYFDGIAEGIMWANAELVARGVMSTNPIKPIYCPPDNLAITRSQYIDILDRYVARHRRSPTVFIASMLMDALAETFPCAR